LAIFQVQRRIGRPHDQMCRASRWRVSVSTMILDRLNPRRKDTDSNVLLGWKLFDSVYLNGAQYFHYLCFWVFYSWLCRKLPLVLLLFHSRCLVVLAATWPQLTCCGRLHRGLQGSGGCLWLCPLPHETPSDPPRALLVKGSSLVLGSESLRCCARTRSISYLNVKGFRALWTLFYVFLVYFRCLFLWMFFLFFVFVVFLGICVSVYLLCLFYVFLCLFSIFCMSSFVFRCLFLCILSFVCVFLSFFGLFVYFCVFLGLFVSLSSLSLCPFYVLFVYYVVFLVSLFIFLGLFRFFKSFFLTSLGQCDLSTNPTQNLEWSKKMPSQNQTHWMLQKNAKTLTVLEKKHLNVTAVSSAAVAVPGCTRTPPPKTLNQLMVTSDFKLSISAAAQLEDELGGFDSGEWV